jgi:hypothetical protein
VLGPIAAAAQAELPGRIVEFGRRCFILRDGPDGLLSDYRRSAAATTCVSRQRASSDTRRTVLTELHSTPLGGHFGRDKTLALARRFLWWPGLPAPVDEFIKTCATCQRVKADHQAPAGLLYLPPVLMRRGGCIQ